MANSYKDRKPENESQAWHPQSGLKPHTSESPRWEVAGSPSPPWNISEKGIIVTLKWKITQLHRDKLNPVGFVQITPNITSFSLSERTLISSSYLSSFCEYCNQKEARSRCQATAHPILVSSNTKKVPAQPTDVEHLSGELMEPLGSNGTPQCGLRFPAYCFTG